MKKSIAIVLAVLSILTVLASCNRRDQYRDPVVTDETTTVETDHMTQPPTTSAPDGTEVTPGSLDIPESSLGTGTPYEGMNKEELLALYHQSSDSSDSAFNTHYYYIFKIYGKGGKAYSKLTGNIVTLCKELGCTHDSCIFSGAINRCYVMNDRMYFTMKYDDYDCLYSADLMMDDLKMELQSESISRISVYDGNVYVISYFWDEASDNKTSAVFMLDLKNGSYTPVFEEGLQFQAGLLVGEYLYYTPKDGSLWKCHLGTKEQTCLLDSSLLNPENGDIRFNAMDTVGRNLLVVWRQTPVLNEEFYYDLSTGETFTLDLDQNISLSMWGDSGQYITVHHNTEAYAQDPHYVYYQDKLANGFVNHTGGEIWRRDPDTGEVTFLARLMTKEIPDGIHWVVAGDGKTILVQYATFEDFKNIYNDYSQITSGNMITRYAVIDLETGTVYKNDYADT